MLLETSCREDSEVIVHSDDAFAPVAYLKMTKLALQDKVSHVYPSKRITVVPCLSNLTGS